MIFSTLHYQNMTEISNKYIKHFESKKPSVNNSFYSKLSAFFLLTDIECKFVNKKYYPDENFPLRSDKGD